MSAAQPDDSCPRLAELIAALSLATDLGIGQPMGYTLRVCLLALHLSGALGLSADELSEVYYVALLSGVGCTADAHESALLFGNDVTATAQLATIDMASRREMLNFLLRNAGAGKSPWRRLRMTATALSEGPAGAREPLAAHCESARMLAGQFGMSDGVSLGLSHIFERWDGHGWPYQLKGEASQRSARIVQLARDAVVFYRLGGVEAAVAVVRQRMSAKYDPHIAQSFCQKAPHLLAATESQSAWEAVLDGEPGAQPRMTDEQLDTGTQAIADFVDLKSPWLTGHSRGVAELAAAAARRLGWQERAVSVVQRAGNLHDLGRVGISSGIWDKAGPLTDEEWEQVRLHSYYTERVLSRPDALARLGSLAAGHHERLDGSGYHRHIPGTLLSEGARLLAAADSYHAMIAARPHRPASTPEVATATLRDEVRQGRLDGDAVNAVLAAAGHNVQVAKRVWPAGLSEREVEVLRLVARGLSRRQIGQQLCISEKTADHHVQHIYTKCGVSTRASATLFAMQHRLLSDLATLTE